jgi:hypothetical protein
VAACLKMDLVDFLVRVVKQCAVLAFRHLSKVEVGVRSS